MNEISRVIKRLCLFPFLCLFIFFAGSDIHASAEIQNPPQTLLEITILDKTSDEPIPGAKVNVRVIQENGGDIREEKLTDENGKCTFPIEDKNIEILRLNAVKKGCTPIQISLSASEAQQKISTQHTLYLDKGTKIGGLVQNAQGNPIEDVVVSISLQSSRRNDTSIISGHEEKTDANGLWSCDIIPEKPDRIMIRFTHPNYRTENLRDQAPSPITQLLREMSHVMIMQNQLNLTGQVLDTYGEPIEGALVAQGADRRTLYYPDTKTDSEGRYSFENVKPGEMVLTVQAEGYSPDTISFIVERQMSPIVFRLDPGHTVNGRVIDPNGKPVPDVTVSTDTWREFRSLTWETKTDANGMFMWNSAPADEVMINIHKRRYIIIRNYMVKPSETEYVITLLPELVIHGTVVDANSGEPVNDFIVYPGVEGGAGQDISWKSGLKITKQNDYLYRFTYPSDEYYIRVEAEGYEPLASRAVSGSEGNVVLDFKLDKLLPVSGTVLSPDGKPLADAEVMVVTRQLRVLNGKAGTRPSRDKLSVTTDAAGKFSFFPKTEEYSIVILNDWGYAFLRKDELTSGGNITLSAWSKLEGILKIGDKPGDGETITYNPKTSPQLTGVVFDFQTKTDEKGYFVFNRIFSGEGSVTRLLRTGSDLQLNTHTIQVNALPGETMKVRIGGTGRPVTGKIIIPEQIKDRTGWQYIEGNLNIKSENNPYLLISFNIDNDGSFRIYDVPEGEYLLYVQAYDLNTRISQSSNEQIALLSHEFNVPEIPSGRSDEALKLGELELVITGDTVADQSLIGKTIPNFENITIELSKDQVQGKPILVCFWDYEQRPSRKCILELNKKADEIKKKNVEIAAVHISKIEQETLDNWLEENGITLAIGTVGENESKVRYNWAVKYLPWFVLTDSEHIIIDEGFGINELDKKIEKATKNLSIQETDKLSIMQYNPPVAAKIGLGERLTVTVEYDIKSVDTARIFIRPYTNGKRTTGYKAHGCRPIKKGQGIFHGWFSFDSPTLVDEVLVKMESGEDKSKICTQVSQKISAQWIDNSLIRNDKGPLAIELIQNDVYGFLSLSGKMLDEAEKIKIHSFPASANKNNILVCFWDIEQRPSRHCITQLAKQEKILEEKGVVVFTVHASKTEQENLDEWFRDNNISFPSGMMESDLSASPGTGKEKMLFKLGIESLPWMVLTDSEHIVIDEGFGINELDEKIDSLK